MTSSARRRRICGRVEEATAEERAKDGSSESPVPLVVVVEEEEEEEEEEDSVVEDSAWQATVFTPASMVHSNLIFLPACLSMQSCFAHVQSHGGEGGGWVGGWGGDDGDVLPGRKCTPTSSAHQLHKRGPSV